MEVKLINEIGIGDELRNAYIFKTPNSIIGNYLIIFALSVVDACDKLKQAKIMEYELLKGIPVKMIY